MLKTKEANSPISLSKTMWLSDFKKLAYFDYLKVGYKNHPTLLHELFDVVDISHQTPYYGIIYDTSLDNISVYIDREYDQIILDSVANDNRFTPQVGKRVLIKALEFYNSTLLDRLSKEEYKRWRSLPQSKRDSIYGLIGQ